MKDFAPDLALAIELIEEWDVRWWGQLADGLIQPVPRISQRGMEGLEEFQAWAASRVSSPRSLVAAAVANASRVVDDLSGVFGYEADFKDGHFVVRQWYRDFFQARRYREVADYEVHVRLIHNLVIELIRAINLVIERVRRADQTLLPGHPLAVVAVGPDHKPVQAVEYSEAAATPQPYPGLRAFAAVIAGRDPGGFGHHSDDTPRTQEEFEHWVGAIEKRIGSGSPPPPEAKLPLRLSLPAAAPALAPGENQVPGSLKAAWSAFAVIAAILTLLDRPWALGAAAGFAVVTARFHRQIWRWPPQLRLTLLAFAAAAALGIIAQVAFDELSGGGDGESPAVANSEIGTVSKGTWQPELQGGLEAFDKTYGRRWGTMIDFDAQDELLFKFRLHNDGDETTPPLDVLPTVKKPPEGQPWVVQMFAGPSAELRPVSGASAVLRPQSRGVDGLELREPLVPAEAEGEEALDVDNSAWKRLGNTSFEGLTAYRLGRLEAGETKLVTFQGSGWLPENTPYISGHIHFANQGKDHFQVTGSAAPGERLRFHILLNNGGWKGVQTRLHTFVLPHPRRGFSVVKAYADFSFEEGNVVGEAVVSSRHGGGIALRIIPGTTSLWGHKGGDCEGELEHLHKLPDGISQGGVNVGSVGGFRPRDPCIGTEFVRGVEFEAETSPLR